MTGSERIEAYLLQCRVRSPFEDPRVHVPPTPEEARTLIAELRHRDLGPVIVGSVAVFYHLRCQPWEYRPTADLDIWVSRHPGDPVPGWARDESSLGVLSWTSPSAGYVDFLIAGQEFPDGNRTPLHIRRDAEADDAEVLDLLKLKLASFRERDLADAVSLCKALGRVPSGEELGALTETQEQNLAIVAWLLTRLQATA